ncbi:MAG: hypothetical protein ACYC5N_10105, partial [Endomicrobiales bacterium]
IVLENRVALPAFLGECDRALGTKRAEGVMRGRGVIVRMIMDQLLPASSAGYTGIGKLTYLKNNFEKMKQRGVDSVLLERLFEEKYPSVINDYLVDWNSVGELSSRPEFREVLAEAEYAGEEEARETARAARLLLPGAVQEREALDEFISGNMQIRAHARQQAAQEGPAGQQGRLAEGIEYSQMYASRQLKDAIDAAHASGVKVHRCYTVLDGADLEAAKTDILFWLNYGIDGSKFDGMRLDLSALAGVDPSWLRELGRELRPEALVTVLLPEQSSAEVSEACRAQGFKVIRRFVIGREKTGIAAGENTVAELHVPAGGIVLESGELRDLMTRWKDIAADFLSMQMDVLEGGLVSEDPGQRNPQGDRVISPLDAQKILEILKLAPADGRKTAQALPDADIPSNGREALSELKAVLRALQAARAPDGSYDGEKLGKALPAVTEALVPGALDEAAPQVAFEIAKLGRQAANAGEGGRKDEYARRLYDFAEAVAERILLKESLASGAKEGFENPAVAETFARLLLKGELSSEAYAGETARETAPPAELARLLDFLLAAGRYPEAKSVLAVLALRLSAADSDYEGIKASLRFVSALCRYAENSGDAGILDETLTSPSGKTVVFRDTVLALMERSEMAGGERTAQAQELRLYRHNAAVRLGRLLSRGGAAKALEEEAQRYREEALAFVPETAEQRAACIELLNESGLSEKAARELERLQALAREESGTAASAELLRTIDLYGERRVPAFTVEKIRQPVLNTLSVAGIRGAA